MIDFRENVKNDPEAIEYDAVGAQELLTKAWLKANIKDGDAAEFIIDAIAKAQGHGHD